MSGQVNRSTKNLCMCRKKLLITEKKVDVWS